MTMPAMMPPLLTCSPALDGGGCGGGEGGGDGGGGAGGWEGVGGHGGGGEVAGGDEGSAPLVVTSAAMRYFGKPFIAGIA